jgi:hypothetical protein
MPASPTRLERQLIQAIVVNRLPFRYTGNDRSNKIGKYTPDFMHVNPDKKICIEVGSRFYKRPDYAEHRCKLFKEFGWSCYVFLTDRSSFTKEEIRHMVIDISALDPERHDHTDIEYATENYVSFIGSDDTRRVMITVNERTWHDFKKSIMTYGKGIFHRGAMLREIDAALQDRTFTLNTMASSVSGHADQTGTTTIQNIRMK